MVFGVPGRSSLELILGDAEEKERKYAWLRAVKSYVKALDLVPSADYSKRAKIRERIGYAYFRAAMQAEHRDDFESRCNQATEYYRQAKALISRIEKLDEKARALRCDAMIAYLGYWLASEVPEKKRLLDVCWTLAKKSLKEFKKAGNAWEYGRTYNQLSISAFLGSALDWSFEARERVVREAVEHGEQAIKFLSTLEDHHELAAAYVKTAGYLELFGFCFLDLNEREKPYQKALDYWHQANELSQGTAQVELLNSACLAVWENQDWMWGSDQSLRNLQAALEYGRKTRDKFIIGSAYDWLAWHGFYNAEAVEDPDQMVESFRRALDYALAAKQQYSTIRFTSPLWGSLWAEAPYAEYYYDLATFQADPEKRRELLGKALDAVVDYLKLAEQSRYPEVIFYAHVVFSVVLFSLAKTEASSREKTKLLEKALSHRAKAIKIIEQYMPYFYWKHGLLQTVLADIKFELAESATNSATKRKLLQEAALDKANSLKLGGRYVAFLEDRGRSSLPSVLLNLGKWQYDHGNLLTHLYEVTHNIEHLRMAAEAFQAATMSFEKLDVTSRVAECVWKLAQISDTLGDYAEAAKNFNLASDYYRKAAEKIRALNDFYTDHVLYMQAWKEIEEAKSHHKRHEYDQASEHFEKAASLHESLRQWDYFAPNYSAWAYVERAEDLSGKELSEEAFRNFEKAAELFNKAGRTIKSALRKIESPDEMQMAKRMLDAAELRREYCLARMTLEEARIFDKSGDHRTSSQKYAIAEEILQRIASKEPVTTGKELQPLIYLCKAWAKMMKAEARSSAALYGDAAKLFEQARETMQDESTSQLALAHSSLCKAMQAGTEFEGARNSRMYSTTKRHMEAAANYYLKAGFNNYSEYVRATQHLFDAYMYLNKAQIETEPAKKTQYYQMAEKLLKVSVGSYLKAKYSEKSEVARRLLESVRTEKQLALSLTEVLHAPTMSSTASFSSPAPTYEEATGLEKFEHANIQAHITASERVMVGEELEIQLDLVNVARNFGLLVRAENVVPSGFKAVKLPDQYELLNGSLDLRGKRLEPLKVETLKFSIEAIDAGTAYLCPKVVYTDDTGNFRTCRSEAIEVTIHPPLVFKFKTNAAKMAFDYLILAFVEDYMKRRLVIQEAGWRSLVQIAKDSGVSLRSVYGNAKRRGSAISELERRGFIETRIFSGKRGRGGKITKLRISYAKETMKRYIDAQVARGSEPTISVLEAVLPGRIATGCLDLDSLLYGGIPENFTVILTSPSCDERDLLIRKFLETGARDRQTTFYVTIEASGVRTLAEEFQSHFYLFICNPRADTMIKSLPNVFKLKGVENITDIDIALMSAFRGSAVSSKGDQRRACIEIVSDVLLQHHAVDTRRWLARLIPDLRSRGFTTLAVMNPYMHSSEEVHAIIGLFDGEINIYEKETTKGSEKFIKVKRMYNQRYSENELPLKKGRLEK